MEVIGNWKCNEERNPVSESIRRAALCRQLEYGKNYTSPHNADKDIETSSLSFIPCPCPVQGSTTKVGIGNPVGTSFGTIGISSLKPDDISIQAYSCCLIALGMAFVVPENLWSGLVINQILQDGKRLVDASMSKDETVTLTEVSINKRFVINNNVIDVEIFDPEFVGKVESVDVTVPRLLAALKRFFKFSSYCLLWFSSGVYYLLWRKHGMFFIWDSYGRDQETLEKKDGLNAALVAVRCPENIYHYIVNLGKTNPDEMFSIRKVQIGLIIPNCSNAEMYEVKTKAAVAEFQVVSDKYAILRGHIHVGTVCFREFRYKQSLAVAIIALLYSKIVPPCSWDRLVVDEIVILGTIFYKIWNSCAHCFDLVIYDVPKRIRIGQYMVEISVEVKQESGEWRCVSNYRHSALTKSVKRCFEKSHNILLQVEGKTYAIWKRNDVYYVFDPYEHQANRGEIERYKTSILHMCTTINQCCLILTQLILEIPSVRSYHMHAVRILDISDCRIESEVTTETSTYCMTRTRGVLDNEEVVSLNDFVEDLACEKVFECIGGGKDDDDVSFADLDSPGMSETQIPRDYFEIRDQIENEAEMAEAEKRLKEQLEKKLTEERDARKQSKKLDQELEEQDLDMSEEGGEELDDKDEHTEGDEDKSKRQVSGSEDEKKEKAEAESKKQGGDGKNGKDKKAADKKDTDKKDVDKKDADKKDADKKDADKKDADKKVADKKDADKKDADKKEGDKKDADKKDADKKDADKKDADKKDADKKDADKKDADKKDADKKDADKKDADKKDADKKDADKSKGGDAKDADSKDADDKAGNVKEGDTGGPGVAIKGKDGIHGDGTKTQVDEDDLFNRLTKSSDTDEAELLAKICQPSNPCAFNKKLCKNMKIDTGKEAYKQKCLELDTRNAVSKKKKETRCPTVSPFPKKLAVIGTEKCTQDNLRKLFKAAFKCTDRILAMTKFGNYVIFKCFHEYYLFDGCTCNINRFRYLDLSTGTAGFIHLSDLEEVIKFILNASDNCNMDENRIQDIIQDICNEYCGGDC